MDDVPMNELPHNSHGAISRMLALAPELGGGIGGGAIGAAAGLLFGPEGAVAGAAIGGAVGSVATTTITQALSVAATEFNRRVLGRREEIRVSATFVYAGAHVQAKLAAGHQLRDDTFFQPQL